MSAIVNEGAGGLKNGLRLEWGSQDSPWGCWSWKSETAIETVPPLDPLTFGQVTAALCLCVFKDKRQKHLGSFLFPCFHLAGKEHGGLLFTIPGSHQSLPVRAEPQLICGQDRPPRPMRTLRVLLLRKDSIAFTETF